MSPKSKQSAPTRAERTSRAMAVSLAVEQKARRQKLLSTAGVAVVILLVVGALFALYRSTSSGTGGSAAGGSGKYVYQVGQPGPGAPAIDFTLPSTKGGQVSVADLKGKTVLTYWHEGLGCQPCWDQIRDIDKDQAALKAAGVDEFVNITSGPLDALKQKVADDRLSSVTLADTDLSVSKKYQMNKYGMMGDSRDGHSFVLLGPDGKILWRADYGGSPNYTMYVPVDELLAQMKAGRTP